METAVEFSNDDIGCSRISNFHRLFLNYDLMTQHTVKSVKYFSKEDQYVRRETDV